jgi:hypothetical protein
MRLREALVTDPVMVTIATTLVAWATTTLADHAKVQVASLVSLLRDRFRGDPPAAAVVEAAIEGGGDEETTSRLAQLLETESSDDPGFGEHLRALWTSAAQEINALRGDNANVVVGDVSGSVVQARDIHGGVSFDLRRHDE